MEFSSKRAFLSQKKVEVFHDHINCNQLEQFLNECRKTKTKVITLANQKGRRQSIQPIKTQSNYT